MDNISEKFTKNGSIETLSDKIVYQSTDDVNSSVFKMMALDKWIKNIKDNITNITLNINLMVENIVQSKNGIPWKINVSIKNQ